MKEKISSLTTQLNLKKHADIRALRYVVVGGSAYLLEMSFIILMEHATNLSSVQLVAISFWLGLTYAFIAQKYVTFKERSKELRVLRKQTTLYILLVAWNYLFTLVVTQLLSDVLPVLAIRTLVILTITIWNYQIYKHIFDTKPRSPKTNHSIQNKP